MRFSNCELSSWRKNKCFSILFYCILLQYSIEQESTRMGAFAYAVLKYDQKRTGESFECPQTLKGLSHGSVKKRRSNRDRGGAGKEECAKMIASHSARALSAARTI